VRHKLVGFNIGPESRPFGSRCAVLCWKLLEPMRVYPPKGFISDDSTSDVLACSDTFHRCWSYSGIGGVCASVFYDDVEMTCQARTLTRPRFDKRRLLCGRDTQSTTYADRAAGVIRHRRATMDPAPVVSTVTVRMANFAQWQQWSLDGLTV